MRPERRPEPATAEARTAGRSAPRGGSSGHSLLLGQHKAINPRGLGGQRPPTPFPPLHSTSPINYPNHPAINYRGRSQGSNGGPSAYGTYDMGGNVWEWDDAAVSDSSRVDRGGSWPYFASYARSDYRGNYSPSNRNYNLGFRLARSSVP